MPDQPSADRPAASDVATAMVLVLGPEGVIERASRGVAQALGRLPGSLIGRPIAGLLARAEDGAVISRVLAGERPKRSAVRLRRRDGTPIDLRLDAERGADARIVVVLEPAAPHGLEAVPARRPVAAVSRDLRISMDAILGFAQALRGADLDAERLRQVDAILVAGGAVMDLLEEIEADL